MAEPAQLVVFDRMDRAQLIGPLSDLSQAVVFELHLIGPGGIGIARVGKDLATQQVAGDVILFIQPSPIDERRHLVPRDGVDRCEGHQMIVGVVGILGLSIQLRCPVILNGRGQPCGRIYQSVSVGPDLLFNAFKTLVDHQHHRNIRNLSSLQALIKHLIDLRR